ncbi:MAG: DUF899 family protein [Fimbriimonadaceae bacterium]|nr:DUF899 family protein [Fimbriimonadaceae bacterium]
MNETIRNIESQIEQLKQQLAKARAEAVPEPVANHQFESPDGDKTLSDLFGDQEDLLVIHNMGQSCNYCTLWADGLDAFVPHLQRRAAVMLVNGDPLEQQASHKASRAWRHMPMVRDASGEFTKAMGMMDDDGDRAPGISGFRKATDGSIHRTGTTWFGPGDDFCSVWPAFELLAGGSKGWEPR